ncbi:MAG: signal recognition particle-docking protein FtsY [Syntrophomonadaceae bacterium]|jgi:fused signal recognition particle receptor
MEIFKRFQRKANADNINQGSTGEASLNEPKTAVGILDKFKLGLSKTRKNLNDKISTLVKRTRKLDDDFFEELEEILIQADVGVTTSLELVERIKKTAKAKKINEADQAVELLKQEIQQLLACQDPGLMLPGGKTNIILVVGVNGAGKTTSIAKMAYRFKRQNQKVLLVAADTFRAAAIDQIQIWADRVGVDLIKHQEGSDPGAVVYDAINASKARKADVLIIDTAGRLQNKTNLMKEISKVKKIIENEMPESHLEVLLVLDATTGQNAISQAKVFQEATGISGIILTKLDGTAKGGIVLAIAKELNLPVKLVGIGEKLDDLRDFSPGIFAQALFDE